MPVECFISVSVLVGIAVLLPQEKYVSRLHLIDHKEGRPQPYDWGPLLDCGLGSHSTLAIPGSHLTKSMQWGLILFLNHETLSTYPINWYIPQL